MRGKIATSKKKINGCSEWGGLAQCGVTFQDLLEEVRKSSNLNIHS